MESKSWRAGVFGAGVVGVFGLAGACSGGGPSASSGASATSTSAGEALQLVNGCESDFQQCVAMARAPGDALACGAALHGCLQGLVAEAGVPVPPVPIPTGSVQLPVPLPLPGVGHLDGGFPHLVAPDAGLPHLLDGSVPVPPVPVPPLAADAGGPIASHQACIADLQQCLQSPTGSPITCASQAQTCLEAAATAECDALQQRCQSAGLPQALCAAQRQACH